MQGRLHDRCHLVVGHRRLAPTFIFAMERLYFHASAKAKGLQVRLLVLQVVGPC